MKLHLSVLSIAMLCATSAQASTVDLEVRGTIVPAACTIALTNGGAINLGQIDLATLSDVADNPQTAQNIDVTISCGSAAKVATIVTDNRTGTASTADNANFGLNNTSGGNPIGFYKVFAENGLADSVAATVIGSTNATSWVSPAGGVPVEHGNAKYTSVGDTTTGPASAATIGWTLRIEPTIASRSSMGITRIEPIDGMMTLTLVYL
jgi:type 1 fimbria pilin